MARHRNRSRRQHDLRTCWQALGTSSTLVVFMGRRRLRDIAVRLIQLGKSDTPIAVVSEGSLDQQQCRIQSAQAGAMRVRRHLFQTPPCLSSAKWSTTDCNRLPQPSFVPFHPLSPMNTKFPIFLKPESLTFNVFGGSEIAEEKLHFLLKSSPHARVRVFASSFSEPVQALIDRHPHVRAIPHWRAWPWQVGRNDVSIVATIEPREVKWSVGLGRLMGHLLNVADVPERCDFYMGGIVTNGSLKLAISTDGKAPILAKRMREWLEDVLPEDVESNLDELQALRRELKGDFAQKQATLRALTRHFRDQQAS